MNGGPVPDIRFFHVDWINVGSKRVRALRHGMAGAPGLEIWGPHGDLEYVRSVILESARAAGVDLHQVGSRAYSTNTLESGRSEEHTSELQSLMRISYAVLCLE